MPRGQGSSGNDQLPKFLYDQIPTEITNKLALNSKIKQYNDSPYSSARPNKAKTESPIKPRAPVVTNKKSSRRLGDQKVKPDPKNRNVSGHHDRRVVSNDSNKRKLTVNTSLESLMPEAPLNIPIKVSNPRHDTSSHFHRYYKEDRDPDQSFNSSNGNSSMINSMKLEAPPDKATNPSESSPLYDQVTRKFSSLMNLPDQDENSSNGMSFSDVSQDSVGFNRSDPTPLPKLPPMAHSNNEFSFENPASSIKYGNQSKTTIDGAGSNSSSGNLTLDDTAFSFSDVPSINQFTAIPTRQNNDNQNTLSLNSHTILKPYPPPRPDRLLGGTSPRLPPRPEPFTQNEAPPLPSRPTAQELEIRDPGSQPSTPVKDFYSSKRISRGGYHSNSSSMSGSVNNPDEWTIENVTSWLESRHFNESWIMLFTNENLTHNNFLKLHSYEELKKYIPFLVTDDPMSTPTRFIQLLRKTLGKSSSLASATDMTGSPISLISESSAESLINNDEEEAPRSALKADTEINASTNSIGNSYGYQTPTDGNSTSNELEHKYDMDIDTDRNMSDPRPLSEPIGEKLVPVVSAPTLSTELHPEEKQRLLKRSTDEELPLRQFSKPRPVSTIERSAYSIPYNASSPSMGSKTYSNRHQKSNSSESSLFLNLKNHHHYGTLSASTTPSTASSGQQFVSPVNSETPTSYTSFKKQHERSSSKGSMSDATTPKGIFNKFFGKSKVPEVNSTRQPRNSDSPVSPSSLSAVFSTDPKKQKKIVQDEKKRLSAMLSDHQDKKNRSIDEQTEKKKGVPPKTAAKNVPKFEKLGPVGKKPSPAGVTIPVVTKSTLHRKNNNSSISSNASASTLTAADSIQPSSFSPVEIKSNSLLPPSSELLDYQKTRPLSLSLDKRLRPVSNKSNSDLYVLITSDNRTFTPVNVCNFTERDALKTFFLDVLGLDSDMATIYQLTDFGCDPGEPLDDSTFDGLIQSKFMGGTLKMMVYQADWSFKRARLQQDTGKNYKPDNDLTLTSSSSYSNSVASEASADRFMQTPQYLIGTTTLNKNKEPIDYLNFKEGLAMDNNFVNNHHPNSERRKSTSSSIMRARSITTTSIPDTATYSTISSTSSNNSFRVIRPEKREIDFDKRRESPFTRQDSLVAHRTAPPAPISQDQLEASAPAVTRKGIRKPPPPLPRAASEQSVNFDGADSLKTAVVVSRKETIRRKPTTRGKSSNFDPFQENIISFADAPSLDDSCDGDSDDSDDGLFAKAPTKSAESTQNRANSSSATLDTKTQTENEGTFLTSSSNDSLLDIRPPAAVLYDNLEVYFPNTDLDKLIIDEVVSPPVSPITENPNQEKLQQNAPRSAIAIANTEQKRKEKNRLAPPESVGKIHRMKSIRIVAQEAKKAAEKHQNGSRSSGSLLRRTNTKMWGQKTVEVTASNRSQFVNKLRNQRGQYKEFAWVKGELIGIGTFGKVYLALNVTTGEMIAVKQTSISSKFINNRETKEIVDTFKAEVDSLKDLDHVNIVQYLGFEKKEHTYSVFLEYVSGGSIGHLLRSYGKFPENLIVFLTEQVLQGLSYIHSQGILHRDLKADNLLLETDGVCKISDFGISKKAKDIYSNESAMSFQGTIFWMAPEIIDNTAHKGYNAKVDIWSLGCVVLEMYAGKRPWHDFAIAGAILKLGTKSAPPITEETKKLMGPKGSQFLDKCFEIEPENRPTAGELLKHPFCTNDPKFMFEDTELAKKMKFDDKQEEKKAEMMRNSNSNSNK